MLGGGPVKRLQSYLTARLAERATWAAIGAVIPTAVSLESPWCWVALASGVFVALIPSNAGAPAGEPK